MESSIIVIFYSKYSPRCTEFFDLVRDIIDFRKICVDHPEIRTTLLNEKDKYSIRKVPTVIVFFSNGVMNKYEDAQAFEWAYNVRKNMIKPLVEPPIPVQKESYSPTFFNKQVTEIKLPEEPQQQPQPQQQAKENVIEDESLMGMKRRIETTPLIQRPTANVDDQRMDGNRNDRKVHDKKQDNIKNLAQLLQAEREKEDAEINPNAISKITT
jgi:hypothetical protein